MFQHFSLITFHCSKVASHHAGLQNQHRDMAVAFMQRRMIIDGFYPTSNMWTLCALNVLGKDSLVDAKKDMSKYLAVQKMV